MLCDEAKTLIERDYLAKTNGRYPRELQEHLLSCRRCRAHGGFLARILQTTQMEKLEGLPEDALAALLLELKTRPPGSARKFRRKRILRYAAVIALPAILAFPIYGLLGRADPDPKPAVSKIMPAKARPADIKAGLFPSAETITPAILHDSRSESSSASVAESTSPSESSSESPSASDVPPPPPLPGVKPLPRPPLLDAGFGDIACAAGVSPNRFLASFGDGDWQSLRARLPAPPGAEGPEGSFAPLEAPGDFSPVAEAGYAGPAGGGSPLLTGGGQGVILPAAALYTLLGGVSLGSYGAGSVTGTGGLAGRLSLTGGGGGVPSGTAGWGGAGGLKGFGNSGGKFAATDRDKGGAETGLYGGRFERVPEYDFIMVYEAIADPTVYYGEAACFLPAVTYTK